jgi:hypothetical protein
MKKSMLLFALILMLSTVCFTLTACGEGNVISFKTLEANGTDVYGSVPNEQTTFSFVDEINVSGGAKYVVALDEFGMQTVATKIVSLRPGDNTFYIIETVNGAISQIEQIKTDTLAAANKAACQAREQGRDRLDEQTLATLMNHYLGALTKGRTDN